MKTIKTKVYSFNELSEDAKQEAFNWWINKDYSIDLYFFDKDATEYIKTKGFDDIELQYSLSYCQGDGLSFAASINMEYWIEEYSKNVQELKQSVKDTLYNYVEIESTGNKGHYCYAHENQIDFKYNYLYNHPNLLELSDDIMDFVSRCYVDICNDLEKQGYGEIEYRQSEEYLCELFEANEYLFTKDGRIFNY